MTIEKTAILEAPVCNIDAYAQETLLDRSSLQYEVRETAPVVWMSEHNVYATGRHKEVKAVLDNWQTFQVGAGVGIANFHTEKPWRPRANPTETDPPDHDAPRRVLSGILSMRALRRLREKWNEDAEATVERVLARNSGIDAMRDLASAFPLRVFPDAVGLPEENREDLLAYGDLVFNAFGPQNDLFKRSATRLAELSSWITELCQRENLTPGGFGAQIWEASDRGELLPEQAPLVTRSLLSAGIDTTVHGIAALLHAFATHPEQWDLLRERPSLARQAFDEAVRWSSPLQTVFHTTSQPVRFGEVDMGKHQKIMLLLGAANRDPRHWDRPDEFDISRDPSGHLGFGMGIHQCVGQHVARLEAESLMNALARNVKRIELAGEPLRGLNNTLVTWETLPIKLHQ
ncbi:cytochrome P450 [Auritidibacter ignavus]|uniref:cytochrome P450 n=1 Tax=Auritidibacter ignavus TaxID=678932 RepID=UPI002FE5D8B1